MIKEQKLFKTSKAMCSDLQWKIRLEIAKDLQQIIPKCDSQGTIIEGYAQELVELINDHDSFVRIEAIESYAQIADMIQKDTHQFTYLPCLKQLYEEKNEEILQTLTKVSGKILFKLRKMEF